MLRKDWWRISLGESEDLPLARLHSKMTCVQMVQVYGNAYVIIAAALALNDKKWFLGLRSEYMYKAVNNEKGYS